MKRTHGQVAMILGFCFIFGPWIDNPKSETLLEKLCLFWKSFMGIIPALILISIGSIAILIGKLVYVAEWLLGSILESVLRVCAKHYLRPLKKYNIKFFAKIQN